MSLPESREVLSRASDTVRHVHDGLLTWVNRTLVNAGLEGVQISSDFPPDGRTAPTMVIFPYRFGPDPLHSSARPCSLLGLGPDYRPGSVGLPEPWAQLGALLTEALKATWPRPSSTAPIPRAVPVPDLPAPLRAWYEKAPADWQVRRNGVPDVLAPLPSLWYLPGLTVAVHYLVSGGSASRGVLPAEIEATSLLLSALSAVATSIHHEGGFDLSLMTPNADPALAAYVRAVAATVADAKGPPPLTEALMEAAKVLNARQTLPVGVLLTQELGSSELFSLIQALQRPLKASFCLRVSIRLGDILRFGPAAEPRLELGTFERFAYTPFDAGGGTNSGGTNSGGTGGTNSGGTP